MAGAADGVVKCSVQLPDVTCHSNHVVGEVPTTHDSTAASTTPADDYTSYNPTEPHLSTTSSDRSVSTRCRELLRSLTDVTYQCSDQVGLELLQKTLETVHTQMQTYLPQGSSLLLRDPPRRSKTRRKVAKGRSTATRSTDEIVYFVSGLCETNEYVVTTSQ